MSHSAIRLVPASEAVIPGIVDLMIAQQGRQFARDPQLAPGTYAALNAKWLREHPQQDALVALNAEGRVRGYAQPAVWTLKTTSILLAFLTARNGIVQKLTLPDPAAEDAQVVTSALLTALDHFWQLADTAGDVIRWPGNDSWCQPAFMRQGFELDSVCALRSLRPFFVPRPEPGPSLHVRYARPEDEERLVTLFQEELLFHERYTPFVRSSPQVLAAFRSKLGQIWHAGGVEEGTPLVLVAERKGAVVAMAENTLMTVASADEPGFTPAGRYWCIDNVSVHKELQGQGVGRLLVQAIEDTVASLHLDLHGYALWFNPSNTRAARFWSSLGFQPLWTTYQRLHTGVIGARRMSYAPSNP
jgi:GNAT superfamily N-acetyltransferase